MERVRTAILVVTGLVLLGAGIVAIVVDVPGCAVVGPVLIVTGVVCKVAGFVLDAKPPPRGRTATTLGGRPSERPARRS